MFKTQALQAQMWSANQKKTMFAAKANKPGLLSNLKEKQQLQSVPYNGREKTKEQNDLNALLETHN